MPLPLSQLDDVSRNVKFLRTIQQIDQMLAANPDVEAANLVTVFAGLDVKSFFTTYNAALLLEIKEDLNNLDVDPDA